MDFDALINSNNYVEFFKFKNTNQEKEWHGEGDVYIHTTNVINELQHFISDCSPTEIKILEYAAAFHDYGKPQTTTTKNKNGKDRIVAPYHEEVGASLLFYAHKPYDLTYNEWYIVLSLVRYHDKPKKLINSNAEYYEYFNLARKCNLKLLYILEKADIKGRVCSDYDDQMLTLELFKIQAQEFNLFNGINYEVLRSEFLVLEDEALINRVFLKALHNFSLGKIKCLTDEIPRSYNYYKNDSHVSIYCGISSSGKSTIISAQQEERPYKIISLDDIREEHFNDRSNQKHNDEVRRIAHDRLKQYLREGNYIIYDATNLKRDFRNKVISTCMNYDAFVRIMIPSERDINTILKDNRKREHSIPDDIIIAQSYKFELPDLNEAHEVNYAFLRKS